MKKIVSLTLVLTLTAGLAGCSAGNSRSSESSVIVNESWVNDSGKTVLTVGTCGGLPSAFNDNMNMPSDIEIECINYALEIDNADTDFMDKLFRTIDMELIAGNVPDMFILPPEAAMVFGKRGAAADMFTFMDEYGGLQREDFLPNMLEGMTVDGRLPALVQSVYIATAAVKTKYVPKEYESWTPEQAMEFYGRLSELKEDMSFIGENDTSDTSLLTRYFLRRLGDSCIDLKNSSCDFISGAFVSAVDFCAQHPVTAAYATGDMDGYIEYDLSGLNDTRLVYTFVINGFNDQYAEATFANLNSEDITFVGYPSEDGCGADVFSNGNMIGITKQCSDPERAWELVQYLMKWQKKLEKYAHDGTRGVPVLKELLDRDYRRSEEYGNSINRGLYRQYDTSREPVYITQEYKEMLRDYLFRVEFRPYAPSRLRSIVFEEADYAVAGERSAQQCAEILQDRLSTYLSENS